MNATSVDAELRERPRIAHRDPLALELDPAARLETAQQAADDLAHGAELVGELLVRGVDHRAALHEELREALVELTEGDLVDELHHLREALAVHRKDEAAEGLGLDHQRLEDVRRNA